MQKLPDQHFERIGKWMEKKRTAEKTTSILRPIKEKGERNICRFSCVISLVSDDLVYVHKPFKRPWRSRNRY